MKILHCHTSLTSGGIEAMVVNLANQMSDRHHVEICLIFKPKENDVFYKEVNDKVHVISLGKTHPGFSIKHVFALYNTIKRGHYDIVQLHGFFYYYFFSILLLHRKTKFFYTVHSDAFKENVQWDRHLFCFKRMFFKYRYMYAVTISKESQRSFDQLYNASNFLIYNGVHKPSLYPISLNKYRLAKETKILFNPARITEQKNQVILCQVCKKLLNEGFDFSLLIAGSIQDASIYKRMKEYFNERIVYLGICTDIPSMLKASDALCLPSLWEGMPVVVLEAFSVGCIPVCSPVGGIIDCVHDGINGILSQSPNENDYYDALKRFLQLSPEEIQYMKQQSEQTFHQFDISETALKYEEVYRQSLQTI
jgi:glycosyltransferase involved in cell wall biosynthesis